MKINLPFNVHIVEDYSPFYTYDIGPGFVQIFPILVKENEIVSINSYQLAGNQDFSLDFIVSDKPWSTPAQAVYPLREVNFVLKRVPTHFLLCDWKVAPPLPLDTPSPLGVNFRQAIRKLPPIKGTPPDTVIWRLTPGQYFVNIQNLENRLNKYFFQIEKDHCFK